MAKLSRRRANAALQELAGRGLVKLGYGEIILRDRQALAALVEAQGAEHDA